MYYLLYVWSLAKTLLKFLLWRLYWSFCRNWSFCLWQHGLIMIWYSLKENKSSFKVSFFFHEKKCNRIFKIRFKKIYRKVSEKTNTIISLQDLKYFLWIFWNIFSNLFWFCLSGGAEARRWQEVESAANFNVVKWFLKIERIFS